MNTYTQLLTAPNPASILATAPYGNGYKIPSLISRTRVSITLSSIYGGRYPYQVVASHIGNEIALDVRLIDCDYFVADREARDVRMTIRCAYANWLV